MRETVPISLKSLARGLQYGYVRLWRWAYAGVFKAHIRDAGGKSFVTVDLSGALEAAVIVRLRKAGIPLQRIRRAVAVLRSRDFEGAKWLALTTSGRDVILRNRGALEDVISGQNCFSILDLESVREEVQEITRKEALTA